MISLQSERIDVWALIICELKCPNNGRRKSPITKPDLSERSLGESFIQSVIPSEARNLHLLVFMGIMQMLRFAQHDSLISSQLLGERVSGDGVFSSRRRTGEGSLPRRWGLTIRTVRDLMP